MTLTPDEIFKIAHSIYGWLDRAEAVLLYRLAVDIPNNGVIVEIGSYRGKSTVVLALGAQERGGMVYAIDPYEGIMDEREVNLHDRDIMADSLHQYRVQNSVEVITGYSVETADQWDTPIDLIFIDGSHLYEDVLADLEAWSPYVTGKIALHDHNENWSGVLLAVAEFVDAGGWRVVEQVDATVVLERVENKKAVKRT